VEEADLVLWVIDASQAHSERIPVQFFSIPAHISVINKIDLARPNQTSSDIALSAKTGEGMPALVDRLSELAGEGLAKGEPAVITRARHRAELQAAAEALARYREETGGPELKAEELRVAARHLGRLTGRIDVDEVLGAIFSEFCIGK
jgi:tRNA modification GTPase